MECEVLGGRGLVIPTVVSSAEQAESAAGRVEEVFGPIDRSKRTSAEVFVALHRNWFIAVAALVLAAGGMLLAKRVRERGESSKGTDILFCNELFDSNVHCRAELQESVAPLA
jgi:hypothetical protein